jgi:hypothetical protein
MTVPFTALDDRLGWFGTAGSGKTYNAGGFVETLLFDGRRCIIPDPLGVWWGLRLMPDGKGASRFDVVIFGGPHGDLPLNEHVGALIGETVASMQESCILDLSGLGTKAAERRFMLAFLTALYRHASGEPVHVVFDEADMWAPQKLLDKEGDAAKLLGMMETLVRRGRVKGFIPWLISQRPAVLSKDVLSMVDGLVAFKLTSSQDRDALGDWVKGQADIGQWSDIWKNLPTLPRGTGLVWMPSRGVFETIAFPPKKTFDSSRTPKRGETVRAAKLAPLNIGALRERMSEVEQEAKASDPKALKAEIERLKREAGGDPQAIETARAQGYSVGHADASHAYHNAIAVFLQQWEVLAPQLERVRTQITVLQHFKPDGPKLLKAVKSPLVKRPDLPRPATDMPRPQQRVLDSLGFWSFTEEVAPTREQVAAVAGYKPGSGNFNNIIGALRTSGMIDIPQQGRVSLVNGVSWVLMDKDDACAKMLSVLKESQKRLVSALAPGESITREELASRSDYQAGSGNFNNLVGSLCTLDILRKPSQGHVGLSEWASELLT